MKGVILAGGTGSRLYPLTAVVNKHLLPVYDRPMILYPLETLRSFGIDDVLIVSGGEHIGRFIEFLGDGSPWGVSLSYRVQKEAGGIAAAAALAEGFAAGGPVTIILGDNVFGPLKAQPVSDRARLWVKEVSDANRFGVLYDGRIVEKPADITEGNAVTGIYQYPADVFDVVRRCSPSARGELEITDVNNEYLRQGRCDVVQLAEEDFWSDAGTFESLARASVWARGQRVDNSS